VSEHKNACSTGPGQSEGPEPSNEEAPTLRKKPVARSTGGRINVFLLVCPPTGDGHGLITDEPAQDEGRAGRNEKDAARPVARRAGRGSWEGEPPRPRL
jgi:hypothetical protein